MSRRPRTAVVAGSVAAIVTAANASEAGYFSQSWGWIALAFLVPATLLVILERATVPGRLRIALAVSMGALAAWVALSALWSISASASIREVERMLVYLAFALAVALALRRGDTTAVLAGTAIGAGLVSGYALATRVFPDRFERKDPTDSYRLAEPLGYWNSLGLLAAIGVVLACGFVAHSRGRPLQALGGLGVPVLVTTLYFTFSRGAWAALALGLLATVVVDPRRLRFIWCGLAIAPPTAVCVAYASRQEALTIQGSPELAAIQGHRLAVGVVVAALASCLLAVGARLVADRVRPERRTRRGFDLGLVALALLVLVVGLVAVGGPGEGLDRLGRRFEAEPVGGVNLNDRLFSLSGTGRSEQLRVSWDAARDRPLLGQGAGTFEYLWYERRPNLLVVRDGHSLYADTFAELGVVGIALLVAALLAIALGGVRARRTRFVPSGVAAFMAWAAASAIDWHWEMVGVTLAALLAGAAAMLASERRSLPALSVGTRLALVGVTGTFSVLAVWSLVGNQALFAGREAVAGKDWAQARSDARRAHDLLPWSYEPFIVLGDAEAGAGDRQGALRAYRGAADRDPRNWVAWLRLAQVARGAERAAAYDRVHQLNPRERDLPGEQ